jgi:hypothetical protein
MANGGGECRLDTASCSVCRSPAVQQANKRLGSLLFPLQRMVVKQACCAVYSRETAHYSTDRVPLYIEALYWIFLSFPITYI